MVVIEPWNYKYSHAKTTGQITRDHSIKEDKLGDIPIYSLVGGKWTSYWAFSERVTDEALAALGRTRKADTKNLPIGGGRDYAQVRELPNCDPQLFARYGSRCREVAVYQGGNAVPLDHYPAMSRCEVAFLSEKEKVAHLDDLILRRSLMAYLGKINRPLIDELATVVAGVLGWNEQHKQAEISRTLSILRDKHGVSL